MRRYMNMKTAILCTLLAISLGSLSACADVTAAERGDDVPSRRVSFADLDLTRSAGIATLYSRIKSAARQVCDPEMVTRPLSSVARAHRCVDEATTRAVADVNAPALTNYYLAKTKQTIRVAQR